MMKIVVKLFNLAALFFYLCYKIIVSGWIVGWSVIRGYRGERGIMVEYNPVVSSGWALVLLFSLISMTPGSLSVDISDDKNTLYVHLLDSTDTDDFYRVTGKMESMLKRIFA
jgi:multisubunit Na+/H+ antiporter MnhE subunit